MALARETPFSRLATAYRDLLNELAPLWRDSPVEVMEPMTMTAKLVDGMYRKVHLIGEEKLIFLGTYMGKTGLILQFEPVLPIEASGMSVRLIEVRAVDAQRCLVGITELFEAMYSRKDDHDVEKIRLSNQYEEATTRYGEEFGSW